MFRYVSWQKIYLYSFCSTPLRRSTRSRKRDLDKTHIVCSLRPRRTEAPLTDVFEVVTADETIITTPPKATPEPKKPRRSTRNQSTAIKAVAEPSVETVQQPVEAVHQDVALAQAIETVHQQLEPAQQPIESPPIVSEDEAIVSDTESDMSAPKLRKTPNLRRLRRSFRESLLAKKATTTSTELVSPLFTTRRSLRSTTKEDNHELSKELVNPLTTRRRSLRSATKEDTSKVVTTSKPPSTSSSDHMSESSASKPRERPTSVSKKEESGAVNNANKLNQQGKTEENQGSTKKANETQESPMPTRSQRIAATTTPRTPLSTSLRNLTVASKATESEIPASPIQFEDEVVQKETQHTPQCSPQSDANYTPELMKSFYEHSFMINSPSVFSEDPESPQICTQSKVAVAVTVPTSNLDPGPNSFVITPLELPPSYEEVLHGCRKLDIPEYVFQQPYYSNPSDVSKMTEVGFLVLRIPGNKLNDVEPFQSCVLNNNQGLAAWRRKQLVKIGGPAMLQRYRNDLQIRQYFSSQQGVIMEPATSPPSRQDAKMWLKARELLRQRQGRDGGDEDRLLNNDEDSPIKIKRQKITMMLNEAADGDAGSDDEDAELNCSKLTLTPMSQSQTPASKTTTSKGTPLSCKLRSRRGLKLQFQAAAQDGEATPASSQSSEQSVTSSAALEELERSSFVRQLDSLSSGRNSHDLSFGLAHATLDNTFGFKVNLENLQQAKADIEVRQGGTHL